MPSGESSVQPSQALRGAALLEAIALTCRFGGLMALNGVDLRVQTGELLAIIGPNGAGKSTLFNVITGHVRASSGRLKLRGREITGMTRHRLARLGIGRKYQVPTVFDSLSVRRNLTVAAYGRSPLGRLVWSPPSVHERVEHLMEFLRLSVRSGDAAGTLSHGEKQWLEIGMVLANDPELVLLDEPTAGMTTQETRRTEALLKELAAGHTVVVIEHDIRFVREVAQRVVVLHRGRVLADGTIAEIERDETVRDVYLGRST